MAPIHMSMRFACLESVLGLSSSGVPDDVRHPGKVLFSGVDPANTDKLDGMRKLLLVAMVSGLASMTLSQADAGFPFFLPPPPPVVVAPGFYGPGYYAPGYYWGPYGYRYYRHPYWHQRWRAHGRWYYR
jgi:hypothetical protein